jgi:hypothetical protein
MLVTDATGQAVWTIALGDHTWGRQPMRLN